MNVRNTLIVLVVFSLVVGGAAAQPSTNVASDANSEDVSSSPAAMPPKANGTASLNTSMQNVQRGETVAFNITLKDTNEAHVKFSSSSAKYTTNASIEDANDDDTIVLMFDTSKAGNGALSVSGDDSISVMNETSPDGELTPTVYGLTVSLYNGTTWVPAVHGGVSVKAAGTETTTTSDGGNGTTTTGEGGDGAMETSTTTTDESGESSSGGMPGFGVGAALLALAAVALLARRR